MGSRAKSKAPTLPPRLTLANSLLRKPRYSIHTPYPKQLAAILAARSGQLRELLYGGAAGGGKSDSALMLALQDDWIADGGYSALILRKTFKDLNQPEGILTRAHEWLDGKPGVTWRAQHDRFEFDSGACLQFGHCVNPNSHLNYRGGKYNLIIWEELTDFGERPYRYLFSRQRRPKGSTLPLLTAATSNPGGPGHKWVRKHFVEAKAPDRLFIPASFRDNPHLDQEAYEATLDNLLPVERAWLKEGNWFAEESGSLFERSWFKIVDHLPPHGRVSCRSWDCATSPGRGDFTVGLRMHFIGGHFFIDNVTRGQWGPADVDRIQREAAAHDGTEIPIILEQEAGSSGKRVNHYLRTSLPGFMVVDEPSTTNKFLRALPAARAAKAGRIHLVKGPWVGEFLSEVLEFTGKESREDHDDQVDAFSLAFNWLFRAVGGVDDLA